MNIANGSLYVFKVNKGLFRQLHETVVTCAIHSDISLHFFSCITGREMFVEG